MTDLERLEQELQSIRLTPSKTTDERILADATRALAPRRAFLADRWWRGLVAAAAAVVVVVGVTFLGRSAPMTLADVQKALEAQKWIHVRIERPDESRGQEVLEAELWVGFKPFRIATRTAEGQVSFEDSGAQKMYAYDPKTQIVTVRYRPRKPTDEVASPFQFIMMLIQDEEKRGATSKRRTEVRQGRHVEVFELTYEDVSASRGAFVCDRQTHLPIELEEWSPAGARTMHAVFHYPKSGPTSIYDLGVPRSAKVVERGSTPSSVTSAFSLLSLALAAEEPLFAGEGIVSVVTEIIVKPVSDPDLARVRWHPVASIEASGKPRFHQLSLPAEPGEQYTVRDQTWYDPATGRFVRLLTAGEKPIFANSYDGRSIYSLETDAKGAVRIVQSAVTQDFRPPERPGQFLGMSAGLSDLLKRKDESLVLLPGAVTLEDGSQARVVKAGPPPGGPEEQTDSYWLFKIRKKDDVIGETEWMVGGESALVVRRIETKRVEAPGVPWSLAGIEIPAGEAEERPTPGVTPDMVVSDVSVQQMLKKATFETYILASNPSWASRREITDILDIVSPPHRCFAITYLAGDGRHVVLVQAHTYNTMLGPMAKTQGTLVYTSPTGVKVWSGPRDKWLAGILLQSARAVIRVSPAENRTGYLLETPAGTFPALAINGPVSNAELHALIDSLIPAKEYQGE